MHANVKPAIPKVTYQDWLHVGNQRVAFDKLGTELGCKKLSDWYHVKHSDLARRGVGTVLSKIYKNSLISALKSVYPEYEWIPWKFIKAPRDCWNKPEIHKRYFEWLSHELGITKLDDWYNVKLSEIYNRNGRTLMDHYFGASMYSALSSIYPDHDWLPWKFDKAPKSFWRDSPNQRKFMEWVYCELKLTSMEDWYSVNSSQLQRLGGAGMITGIHKDSMYHTLVSVFPEYPWKGWKFQKTSRGYWTNPSHVAQFITEVSEKLHVTRLDDWYRVSTRQFASHGGERLLNHYKGLYNILKLCYPGHSWDQQRFNLKAKKSTQRWLRVVTEQLFPNTEIHEDYFHPKLKSPSRELQLDLFIPDYRLALEYQGQQHFSNLYYFAPHRQYMDRDIAKRAACKDAGIELIEIPYWWDRTSLSVANTIRHFRPDITFPEGVEGELTSMKKKLPVYNNKDNNYHDRDHNYENTGNSPFMNASTWDYQNDPSGWVMCSKSGGIRVYWNGSSLVTSRNKVIPLPAEILAKFPRDIQLDGELRLKSHGIEKLRGLLVKLFRTRNKSTSKLTLDSDEFLFEVLDAPSLPGSFKDRLQHLRKNFQSFSPMVVLKEYVPCSGKQHLQEYLDSQSHGGVFLKNPESVYQVGLSPHFAQVEKIQKKTVQFVDRYPGGGWLCKQDNGLLCVVKSSPSSKIPSKGSNVEVNCLGFHSSGRLKYPFYQE